MTGSSKKLGVTAAAIAAAAVAVGSGVSVATETSPPIAPDPGPSVTTRLVAARAPTPDKVARVRTPARWPKLGLTPAVRSAPAGADVQVSASVVRVRGKSGRLQLDYSRFRNAYGGDWASRLRLVQLGEKRRVPVPGRNDLEAGTVTAQVAAGEAYALDAAPSGPAGDYKATSLSPSDSWQVSRQTGDFTWSEPIGDPPPVPGDFAPEFALTYASGSVDGRVASTNNQASWVGEGWNLGAGFIERRYVACADDLAPGQPKTGDLCWKTDNATLSLGGRSSQLVKIQGTNRWRPVDDDGSRIERLTDAPNGARDGEHWRVTTPDGTQHYFGRQADSGATWTVPVFGNHAGEPCHDDASFAASHCRQAWRWNLDYSVDPNGNSISYYYAPETNAYGLNLASETATYTRGGVLTRADYGARNGVGPTAQIVFETADRCVTGTTCERTAMPDVPWDQNCDTPTCPGQFSPTFWSTKRLAKVTTRVASGTAWTAVDEWTLAHSFPATGDGSTPALWLDSVTHTGSTGAGGASASTPPVQFVPAPYNNRVDTTTDGLPPMPKFRIGVVRTPAGGEITVVYDRDCEPAALPQPQNNSTRCYPVRWTPEGASPRDDWFAKYVVARVTEADLVGRSATMATDFEYLGGAGWRYNDDPLTLEKHRTWSRYRGYEKVRVTRGNPQGTRSATTYQYFRGLDGDHQPDGATRRSTVTDSRGVSVDDSDQLAGFVREEITYNGLGGPEVSGTINDVHQRQTAADGPLRSYQIDVAAERTRTAVPGGERTTLSEYTYNDDGLVTAVSDLGDVSTPEDDQCRKTEYARDEAAWRLDLPSRQTTVAVACSATPVLPRDAVSEGRTYYDGHALGEPPTTNTAVRVEELDSFDGATPRYVTTERTTLDQYGREVASEDALGRRSTTSFSPETGRPTTSTDTNPKGHRTRTTFSALRGQPTNVLDVDNNRPTDLTYDALGRLTGVWLPGRSRSFGPNTRYRYLVRTDGTSWVATESLTAAGNYSTSYSLLDGFLRERQTQAPGWGGGRVFTSVEYDSRGLAVKATGPEHTTGDPGGDLIGLPEFPDTNAYRQTVTTYDGAERPTVSSFRSLGDEQWRTVTEHHGDGTSVTPPRGGTPERVVTDARGRVVRRLQYRGATPDGEHDTIEYGYDNAGRLTSVTDAMGNRWRYEYDLRGRRTQIIDPDSGTSTSTYDDAGQLRTSTDGRGTRLAYEYDALGRRTAMYANALTGTKLAGWTYDTLPGGVGLPTGSTRFVGSAAYSVRVTGYEADSGRPAGSEVVIPASETGLNGSYRTTYAYRPDGSLASATLPKLGALASETLTYSYDTLGLSSGLRSSLAEYVSKTQYSWFGDRTQLTMGPAGREAWHTQFYEPATGRLDRAFTQRNTTDSTVNDTTYGYDPAGNVTRISDQLAGAPAEDQCFRYDYGRRLTEAWTSTGGCAGDPGSSLGGPAPYWSSWRYDAAGNRTSQVAHAAGGDTTSTYTYPAAGAPRPHAVQSVRTAGPAGTRTDSYDYDDAGNTTATRGQTLAWDDEQNLASMGSSRFVYDADGNRLIRRDAGGSTLYLASGEVRAPADGTPATGTRYYVHNGETVAVRDATGLRYLISDHHGTDEMRIDASTLAVTKRRSDPFGNQRGAQPSWPGSHGFVGGIQDPTGLTHLGAREYDPAIGRFISVDPIIDVNDPQQINSYAYANNSPVTLSDPDGLIAVRCPDGECAGGGYRTNQSPASRFNVSYNVNHRKANTWRPMVGPVQGPRPLCNGFGRCRLPWASAPADVCKVLSPGGCGWRAHVAAEARRRQEAQAAARRGAEAKAAAGRAAAEAQHRKNLQYTGALKPLTRGDCTAVEGAFGIIVVGFSECSITDGTNTRRTRSVKAGVGPRSPRVLQLVKAAVLSEAPIEGSGSNWGWWLDGGAGFKDVSIGRSFAGGNGPRYLAAGSHVGGGFGPSFASGIRFSW